MTKIAPDVLQTKVNPNEIFPHAKSFFSVEWQLTSTTAHGKISPHVRADHVDTSALIITLCLRRHYTFYVVSFNIPVYVIVVVSIIGAFSH